jgi:probable HAF family extracellular repeat protein
MRALVLVGLLSAALISSGGRAAPLFRITDVGPANSPPAINERSQVLIDGNFAGAENAVWTNGVTKNVSQIPDQVFDFNNNGRVVGYTYANSGNFTTPVYWPKAGKAPRTLDSYKPGASSVDRATGINTAGQIAGWLYHKDGIPGVVYWDSNGILMDLKPFIELHCYLFPNNPKINDEGVIAVSSCDHGYRIHTASLNAVQLEGFDIKHGFQCNTCSQAYGLNDNNFVVGTSKARFTLKDGSTGVRNEATLWNAKAVAKDLGVLHIDGYPEVNSYAYAINSDGWVVGWTDNFGNVQRAFLWTPDDKITDLNKLIDPSDPKYKLVTLLSASAINNKGEIVGVLADSTLGGEQRIYMLTPSN